MIINSYIKTTPPEYGQGIRLAVFQGQGPAGTKQAMQHNLNQLKSAAEVALSFGAQLISFPELYLSGYAVPPEQLYALAMSPDDEPLSQVAAIAREQGIGIICPYPERAEVAGETRYYDAITLFGPDGSLLKNYRKTHLWGPDEKKIWTPGYLYPEEGQAFTVHEINGFPVGLLNCYEAEFPELTRRLALNGAKLVVIPTAADESTKLSTGTWTSPAYPDIAKTLIPAHAWENELFVCYSNRCQGETLDSEPVGRYLGNSVIANPHGELMVAAKNEPTLLIADCIPSDYGPTHPENTDYLQDRRPELY
ncbi:carbon-nitrogen hydrolase family protein [Rhabdochromatium marinum]|uniref:carbon-nitrogen hydrolase family protein n=1 Tax=Rhabdochromatium marinum TaxID=48729 RepID=UPI0019031AA4|nr:carbon-nitrogen hydrolase family protein [Rhabdochromatium marinum]MBK1648718.1 nitrilase [Rhabdochromatium marinum]